jgi:chromosome segregation ATPase
VTNRIGTVLLVLLALPVLVSAEIYKYRDPNGVLRFTDNLSEVPAAQRENIEQYQEIKTPVGTLEQTPADASEQAVVQDSKAVEKELTDEKEVLDNEYNQLTETRKSLEAAPRPSTPEESADYEKKIRDYNMQLKSYETKLNVFREKLEAYNKAAVE